MNALTESAAKIIDTMIAQGWQVSFRCDQMLREWEFSKLVTMPETGQVWRTACDPDIEKASREALEKERKGL